MSLRLKLPLHGRSHRHNGSDAIGTFIEYDVLNVGDWLNVEAGPPAGGEPSTEFTGSAQILLQSKGPSSYLPVVLRTSQDNGTHWTEFSVGFGVTDLYASSFTVYDADETLLFSCSHNGSSTAATNVGLVGVVDGTGVFVIRDLTGVRFLEIRPDGTVHIQTGQTIIADLS